MTNQLPNEPALEPVATTDLLRVGSREVLVDRAPLKPARRAFVSHFALSQPRPGHMVLQPVLTARLVAWALCLLGGLALAFGILGVRTHPAGVLLIVWAVGMIAPGLWLLGPRYRFDLDEGQLTTWNLCSVRRRLLSHVLAVQLTDGGGDNPRTYQLNLVLDDPHQVRRHLTTAPDYGATLMTGRKLAEFLTVSLVVAVSESR